MANSNPDTRNPAPDDTYGTVVAVISLHTLAPQEFTDEHVRVVAAMAPILGGAIETSEFYGSTAHKPTVLSTVSGLVQTVRSRRHLEDALHRLAETAARVTASDLCVVIFAEPGAERLAVRAYRPGAGNAPGTSHIGTVERQPWERLAALTSPAELGLGGNPRSGPTPPGAQSYGAQMAAPLVTAGEQLGVMACYSTTARQYAEDDVALLTIIANQAAIAIQNSQLADLLAERDAPARLFRDLMHGPARMRSVGPPRAGDPRPCRRGTAQREPRRSAPGRGRPGAPPAW